MGIDATRLHVAPIGNSAPLSNRVPSPAQPHPHPTRQPHPQPTDTPPILTIATLRRVGKRRGTRWAGYVPRLSVAGRALALTLVPHPSNKKPRQSNQRGKGRAGMGRGGSGSFNVQYRWVR
jgi:hypothetical protein